MSIFKEDKREINKQGDGINFKMVNSFGVIFNENVILHNPRMNISIKQLKKVSLSKKRLFRWNFLFLAISILLGYVYFTVDACESFKFSLITLASVLMVVSLSYFEYRYKFSVYRNNDFTEIKIEKYLKNDAKKLVYKLNSEIKKTNKTEY